VQGPALTHNNFTLTEPICPSSGACARFGWVDREPPATGCPATLAAGADPAPEWVGPVLNWPGTETAYVTIVTDVSAAPFLWCGYIEGPGVPGSGGSLVGQVLVTPPPDATAGALPTPPPATPTPGPAPSPPKPNAPIRGRGRGTR
jgi:hypothetical protein